MFRMTLTSILNMNYKPDSHPKEDELVHQLFHLKKELHENDVALP